MATPRPPSSDWVTAPLTARDIQMNVNAQQEETRVESLPANESDTTTSLQPCPSSSRLGDPEHHETTTSTTLQPAAASHLDDMEVTEFTAPALSTSEAPQLLIASSPKHASLKGPSQGQAAVPKLNLAALAHEDAKWQPKETATAAPPLPAQADPPDSAAQDSRHESTEAESTSTAHGHLDPAGQRQDSATSAISTLGHKLRRLSETFTAVVAGDNENVRDKWDNYDDDLEEEIEAVKRGASMTVKRYRRRSSGDAKVLPYSSAGSASHNFLSSIDGTHLPTDPTELLGEKQSTRTLMWHYSQTFLFSMLLMAVCIPVVALMSMIKWHEEEDMPEGAAANGTAPTAVFHGVRPNHKAMQLMLLFQIIFPLCLYSMLLYACIRRSLRLPWPMVALVCFTMAWATLVCGLFYKFDVAFWFYYIDLFLIVAAYVPCMCMVGWYVEVEESASVKQRLMDVFFTVMLETVVAAATLIYCFFLMPLFFTLTSAWLQMLWLCVLHPLYFEATTGFIVRKVLQRNRQLGRNHILYLLTIVHSMVHVVVLATSLQASIEPVRILALTVFLYNLSKLAWRSTVLQRDLLIERLMHGWSFNYSMDELSELARMVSVGIITEIILENASIIIAPFMMFRMYKEPIFMAVVPNTFFNNGGTYPFKTLLVLIAMLLFFTMIFDIIFYFLNYHMVQHLPLINTWRRIKRSQGWYLAFLIYAFMTMGVLFLFLTMMILPRAAYCKSDNYCDCATLTYRTICEGQYISMLVDYLV